MISLAMARVMVVADDGVGEPFIRALMRMGFAEVRRVACAQTARAFCNTRHADACLVLLGPVVPDEVPRWPIEAAAPEIPTLLVADMVTPYLAKRARSSGYIAVVPARLPPRLLYRHVCALLQKARHHEECGSPSDGEPATPRRAPGVLATEGGDPGEPTLQ